jgi:release factor glutamine methyltransferase
MGIKIRTFKDIRSYLSDQLKNLYPEPEIKALTNIIIKTVTGSEKLHQLSLPEQIISEFHAKRIIEITDELLTGKPVQYVLGETTFYGCTLKLNGEVLIPRPETEELVDLIIKQNQGFSGKILDACTGSGCIAIALAGELPGSEVSGFDISEGALNVAMENAKLNRINARFFIADLFAYPESDDIYDLIVSNPPYVRESEKKSMSKNVLDFEPHQALFVPDSDPLTCYRALLEIAKRSLKKDGSIYFEINEALGSEMSDLLKSAGYREVMVRRDLNNRDRFVKALKNG